MAECFMGEIRMFAGNYAPRDWAFCDGQILEIKQHPALYAILGTTYGGDGKTTFALPNLRGRVPVHPKQVKALGEAGGSESVTLTTDQMPSHSHIHKQPASTAGGTLPSPANNFIAPPVSSGKSLNAFSATSDTTMSGDSTLASGASQPHPNMQPYLCVNFIIALVGIFPTRD